jgi:hypothetical protein
LVAILLSCSTIGDSEKALTTSSSLSEVSPAEYVLPSAVGPYTTVWDADPDVDLLSPPAEVLRATVEAKAVAEMVGRYDSFPGYGRLLDEATQSAQGKRTIDVEDTPSYEKPIALNGTRHYRLYDVIETDTTIAASICDITFGIYQKNPAAWRGVWDPADLQKVTDPGRLDDTGRIPAYSHLWRIELERTPGSEAAPAPETPPPPTTELDQTGPERYPNQDLFTGWDLQRYSVTVANEPRCDAWALDIYPMAVIGNKGPAYPTNPVDPAYLSTLPPYPGWKHVPAD